MRSRTLVTGFLPFGSFDVNPSALLAESCGEPFELLEVSYAAVDEFLTRLPTRAASFDRLLMLGLRGSGATIEIERQARNHVGAEPDVRGEVRGPAPIDPGGPATVPTTLFNPIPTAGFSSSDDAGCYLCNYICYRALQLLPRKHIGFVHVPRPQVMPLEVQRCQVSALIRAIESPAPLMSRNV